jgi:methionine-rich copper-binding protein CopC
MKEARSYTRNALAKGRQANARRLTHARRRAIGLKLEALEPRTLLSTASKGKLPPLDQPTGLGAAYTGMSEQAHGIGIASNTPLTWSDFEAYLKQLGSRLPKDQGPLGSVSSPAGQIQPKVGDDSGDGGGVTGSNLNAYLQILEHDPLITGLSMPLQLPTVQSGFDGMNFLDSVNGYVPPDTDIAVGPNYVVEVVNAQIQVYSKATGAAQLPNTPLNTFFGQPSESPFDTVVSYDDIAGRFIVTSATFSGDLLLAISKNSNPLDGFTTYDINATEGGAFSGDFPKLGWNNDEVAITENMYSNSTGAFDHVQVLSFAASSLFASTPPPTLTLGTDYFSYDRTNNDYTLVPATMHGSKAGDPMYFVEENTYGDGANLRVVSATNLLSSSPSFNDTVIPVAPYTEPPSAQQPGGYINTNDSVILSADYRDGLLVSGQNVGLPTDSDAHARWYEFNVSGTPALAQQGTISPAPGTSTYYPALAIGAGDSIGMTYNESSATEYPSVYDTGRTSVDAAGTMESPTLAHAGTATYSDFAFRWGDYSGISVDPSAPGSFWSGAEYSTSTLSGLPANWATWISQYTLAPTVISSNPAAKSVVTGTAPTTFSLTFSAPIDPASITASNFTVNGIGASSASLSADGLTIAYTFAKSAVTQEGSESMSLPAGSVKGAGDEVGNIAFAASFYYTAVQLAVSATSPAVGSVLVAPITDLVVQFNKAFDPYSITAGAFQLSQGTVVSAKPITSQTVDLTLSGITQDGTVTLTIPAGAIRDTHEVPNAAFSGTYIVQVNSQPYPTSFAGVSPPGSLIYDPTVTGAINFTGDSDTYTLAVAANQTLTVVMSTDPALTGTITVTDPKNNVIGTATVPASGETVVLQTVPVATGGTYSITVTGANGTMGNYTLQLILNAAEKLSTGTNNSTGTAYDLTGAFASLGTTPAADRAGVLGTIDAAADSDFYSFYLNAGQSATLVAEGQGGSTVALELLNSAGALLTLGNQAPAGSFATLESINNFVAGSAGVYYAVISGTAGTNYSMVITRGAEFDTPPNQSIAQAQSLQGGPVALGFVGTASALDQPGGPKVLYFVDFVLGQDTFGQAFAALGIQPTVATSYPDFESKLASGHWDLVVLYDQNFFDTSWETPIINYVNQGGHAIVGTWTSVGGGATGVAAAFGASWTGNNDQQPITQTASSPIWNGVSSPFGLLSPGWFNWSFGMQPTTGQSIGAFPNGDSAIIVGNSGRTILNGFLEDTPSNNAQGVQLAENEITETLVTTDQDYYAVSANAGDNLTIDTTTPGGTTANGLQFANGLDPTITLFDPNGNAVANNTGGAADGRNDHLTYTALLTGTYYVRIAAVDDTSGEYTLSVNGATGGRPAFVVSATDPAAGSDINSEASSMTVSFNDSVLLSSVSDSDFTIDGHSATGFSVIAANTIEFSFPTTTDGVHSVSISGLINIHGTTLTPDSFTFKTDTVPPFVVSSSIANNAVLTPGNLTEVVTFSETMNTAFTTASSFDLHGNIRNVDYAAASFSWDSTGKILTLNYSALPSDAYTLTLFAGGFSDLAGNTMTANFVVNFTMPVGTATISGLTAVSPAGSLVYQETVDDVVVSSTDVATYDLTIDPQQTLAVLVTPVTSSMTATITLTAPGGTVTTVTSPKPGSPALIPAVQSPTGGKYVIQVSGGPGEYKLQTILNALIDPAAYGGPPDGTIGTAQPLDAYANIFASGADRTAVLGSILGTPASFGDALVVETGFNGDVILIDKGNGAILEHFKSTAFSGLYLFDIALAPDNTFYVLGDQNLFTGVIVHMDLNGDTLGTITVPVSDPGGFLSPEGFGLDPRDGSFWIPLTNSATLVHIDASGNLLKEYAIPSNPDDAAVGPDGNIYISQVFSGEVTVFNPTTETDSFFAASPFPLDLTWSVAGDLWVGDIDGGAEEFNSSGTLINQNFDSGATAAEPAPSGNYWDTNVFSGRVNQFTPSNSVITQTSAPLFQPGLAVLGDVPNEAPLPPPVFPVYSIQLAAGESASFIIKSLNQKGVGLTLFDGSGNVLALSSTGATNYNAGINNFVARSAGTYYVQVTGTPGANFNFVVTRSADFDTHKNNSIATAQAFNGNSAILGAITKGIPPFFVLDDNLYSPPFPIWPTDPTTGAFVGASIPAPATEPNNPFGLNMAYDGTYIYYNDGPDFGTNKIYKLDASTGAVVNSFLPQEPYYLFGIAYYQGDIWATDSVNIYDLDANTGAVKNEFTGVFPSGGVTGLTADPDNGMLYAVSQFNTLYEIDPATGAVVNTAPDNAQGLNEQDMAYAGGMLIVSDTNGLASSGGTNVLDEYDPNTLAFIQRLPVAVQGFVSGLAGDGLGSAAASTDYYSFNASAGDSLVINTTTPAGGSGEFENDFYPALTLYNSSGQQVAFEQGNAADGRNSTISYPVPAGAGGTYYVEVSQATNTPTLTVGEYGLVVSGETGALPAMAVTSTTPANGSLVQPPSSYTVAFNYPVYAPSLTAGELTINGVAASAVTLVDAHTVTWTIPAGAIPNGDRVLNTVIITGVQDISGSTLAKTTETFTSDNVAPAVVSSSIPNGQVFSPAPASVTEVVTFSEPMNTAFTTAASFDLHGNYRNADYGPASFSWDPTGTQLTINYAKVPDDTYTLTLFAGGFEDLVGLSLTGDYQVNFAVALGTAAVPTPFTAVPPLGDEIYTTSDTHVLVTSTDVDNLTANLNPGQTLTVVITPTTATLQPVITILDPNNNKIGTATAPAAGQVAVVETATVSTGGIYTVQVSDAGGNLGLYTVAEYLNAYVKTGASNVSIATAQDLSSSSIALGSGKADRLAVVGSIPGGSDSQDYYSFNLAAGQSTTVVVRSLNGKNVQITLQDATGKVLASGVGGSTNVTQSIQNFVASAAGTYYVEVTGDAGVAYSLTITRSANFDIEAHNTYFQAQPLTGTNGALGAIDPGGTLKVGTSIEGIDFNTSNCGCLPPDTNAAVGPNYVGEAVNLDMRFWDKTGKEVLDEPLNTLFAPVGGTFSDPYIEYDQNDNRFYIASISTASPGNIVLAISNDSNPLDGFSNIYSVPVAGTSADFDKMGFNYDAIVLEANDFSTTTQATITVINKADALAGTLVFFQSTPSFQFRALVPAQMNGSKPGDPMWFMAATGDPTYDGTTPNTIRVTKMTNVLSSTPTYTDYSVSVATYGPNNGAADQPGAPRSVATNDVTTTQVTYLNGKLVTAFSAGTPTDGYSYTKAHYYEVDVSSGTPTLVTQGVIDPGAGVATFFPAATIDTQGNLAFSWMESSSTEYVSFWIGAISAVTGTFSSYDAAPGQGYMPESFREGDYGSVVLDPDGTTFWAANEYSGSNPFSDIWNTHITSFSLPPAVNNDWYTMNVAAGNTLSLQTYTPSTQGGEFENTQVSVTIQLYDPFGNLVATGTENADGRNQTLNYNATVTGQYHILVSNPAGSFGEYFLQASTAQYASGAITGEVYNDLNGNGTLDAGEPGLDNWVVQVLGKKSVVVASQLTHGGGNFDFEGLAPGTYTVQETLQSGWTQTAPPSPGTFTASVTAGNVVSGLQFGNFQNIAITGQVYNDLNGDGAQEPGEPALSGWTVQLLNSAGKVVATQVTGASGNYSFANIGPGTYTVQEVLQSGWTLTQPGAPGTYTVAATSGQNVGGLAFGDYQLVTYSGEVYNDSNGNGVLDSGEKGLKGWTVNLYGSMGNLVSTYTTTGNGKYSFGNLGPGIWTISEVNQNGWYQTQPANPPGVYSFVGQSGTNQASLNFGNFQLVNVTGSIYNDVNGDGKKQGSEPNLTGWTVDLLNPAGSILVSTTTDANGNYAFNGLFPGTFTVAQVVQNNWVQTQPLYPTVYTFQSQSGQNQNFVFGDHAATSLNPTAVIDNFQAGYAETGNWTSATGGYLGNNRYASTGHGKNPSATASWTFTGLASGKYDVYITYWSASGSYASSVPYTVYDGSTSLGTTNINQQQLVTQAQGGLTQGGYGSVGWLELGTYSISSGTLEVLLSNLATGGNTVDADAALIIAHGAMHSLPSAASQPPPASGNFAAGSLPVVDTSNASVPAGPNPLLTSGQTTMGKGSASPVASVSVGAVSSPAPAHVIYNQGFQSPQAPLSSSLVDAVLGVVDFSVKPQKSKVNFSI